MKKTLISFLTSLLITSTTVAQIEQLQIYKTLYHKADSVKKLGIPFSIDSVTFRNAAMLDKQHPAKYFEHAGELIQSSKYNEAAFIFYLGILRYRYYNSVNPDYQASGDGALAASLQYVLGESINLYLKNNIDHFIGALKSASEYFAKNDYTFYSKNKNPEKYATLVEYFSGMIKELNTNRTKFQREWDEEKQMMIESIDESIEEYNKMTLEEKAKLKEQLQED